MTKCISLGLGLNENDLDSLVDKADNNLRFLHYFPVKKQEI